MFGAIAAQYESTAALPSLGLECRWRGELVTSVPEGSLVLDVATGTGMVARELVGRRCRVVRLDQNEPMIHSARQVGSLTFVLGRAEHFPFLDGSFDAVTFAYLLRYVDDPAATLRELCRVLMPDRMLACLEFHVPDKAVWRAGWLLYTRFMLPGIGLTVSREWYRAGRFLRRSICQFWRAYPLLEQLKMWQEAGIEHVRYRTLSLGTAIVMYGVKQSGSANGTNLHWPD
jgi:demethylmenaquinone methyltransferase / 2-methoxy-6-polyprenyl-1,4-benzoquinol methylase